MTLSRYDAVFADVAELADAHGSGPCGSYSLQVRLLSSAPNIANQSTIFFRNDNLAFE